MPMQSSWALRPDERNTFPRLSGDASVDVAVIGGGITGVTTAYYLAKGGARVALLERGAIGDGDSGNTTAFLTCVLDTPLTHLARTFGKESAILAWNSTREAINDIEQIITEERITCDFMRCPAFLFAHDKQSRKAAQRDPRMAELYGIPATYKEDGLPFADYGYMEVPDQAKFHPLKYLTGLADAARAVGAAIYEQTQVHDIRGNGPLIVQTSSGTVRANAVVVATHGPVTHTMRFPSRLVTKRTYLIEVIPEAGGSSGLREGLYMDTRDPYHYFRMDRTAKGERILVGGEDHLAVQGEDVSDERRFNRLADYVRTLLPQANRGGPGGGWEMINGWSGQVYKSMDGLPYIGRAVGSAPIYIATGFGGDGMTFGTAAARINSRLILTGEHPLATLYRPARLHGFFPLMKQRMGFVRELLNGSVRTL